MWEDNKAWWEGKGNNDGLYFIMIMRKDIIVKEFFELGEEAAGKKLDL